MGHKGDEEDSQRGQSIDGDVCTNKQDNYPRQAADIIEDLWLLTEPWEPA